MRIPNGIKEILQTYGNPNRADFAKNNLQLFVSVPFTYGRNKPKVFKFYAHKSIIPDLTDIFTEIESLERYYKKIMIHSFDGCFCQRNQRGSDRISTHSFAIAIDINAATNQLGRKPNQSQAMVKCFTKRGWVWGGTWKRKDGMHFQACSGY